jgi:hypothetical protein
MKSADRRARSDARKREAGEIRLNSWLTPEASKALIELEEEHQGKDRRDLLSEIILHAHLSGF